MVMELVLSQIQAWNDGNLSALMDFYSETIQVYEQPENKIIFSSKEDILNHIKEDFENGTVTKINIVSKIELSPYIILVEEKNSKKGPRRAMFTYYIENGKIEKMWLAQSK